MKPSRIAILIWCAIALLGLMCVVLPERMHIGQLTLRWTTIGNVLSSHDEGLNSFVDEGLNSSVDEGLRIKEERLNSTDSDTSETKVISPSSCVLHPSSSAILFIEDVGERHYHIDRMMNNLRLSGVLAKISGLIVGQFSDCEDDPSMGCTVY